MKNQFSAILGFGATSDNKYYGLCTEKWICSVHYTTRSQWEHFCEIKHSNEPLQALI